MLPVVSKFPKMAPQWIMPCIIHTLCTPMISCIWQVLGLAFDWWNMAEEAAVWLLKLMSKTFLIFFLGLLKCSLFGHLEPSCHMVRRPPHSHRGRTHTGASVNSPSWLPARINCQPWMVIGLSALVEPVDNSESSYPLTAEGWDSVSDYYPLSFVNLRNCWTN